MLDEIPTDDIKGSVGTTEQKVSISFRKSKTKFSLSFHYSGNNS